MFATSFFYVYISRKFIEVCIFLIISQIQVRYYVVPLDCEVIQ